MNKHDCIEAAVSTFMDDVFMLLIFRNPSSNETLSSWFTERATEIEELSGQVYRCGQCGDDAIT